MSRLERDIPPILPPCPEPHRLRALLLARRHRVEPVQPACIDRPAKRECPADCFDPTHEPLPFGKLLERQNQEHRAALPRTAPAFPRQTAQARDPAGCRAPDAARWPRLGDISPVPAHPATPRLRTTYEVLPPIRPGLLLDVIL